MKKAIAVLLTVILAVQAVPVTVSAAVSGKTKSIEWRYSDGKLTISPLGESGYTGDWRVYDNAWDWRGHFPWKDYGKKITKIVIKSGIEVIPREAFKDFTKLTEVSIPETVGEIGSDAFKGCKKLKRVTLPKNMKRISSGTFSGCSSLTGIDMPRNLEAIEYQAFDGCSALRDFYLPAGLSELNASFQDSKKLKRMTIPKSLEGNYWRIGSAFNSSYAKLYFNGGSRGVWYGGEKIESLTLDATHIELIKKARFTLEAGYKGKKIMWESLDPEIAEVSENGEVKAKKGGTTQIRAYVDENYYVMCRVDVIVPTVSISVENVPEYISVNELYNLDVKTEPKDSTDKIEYSISNAPRGSVSDNGELKGLSKGSFTLTVKSGDVSEKYKVKVENPKLNKTEKTVTEGWWDRTIKLSGTKRKVSWTSSNADVLKVESNGKVTGLKPGYSCLIAKVGQMEYYCDVRVISTLEKRISELQDKYPDGYYWNRNTPSEKYPDVSEKPCEHQKDPTTCKGQCAGYANLISNEVFGANAPRYRITDSSKVKSGDYVRYGNHSVFIIYVVNKGDIIGYDKNTKAHIYSDKTTWYITHCNWNRDCGIIWYMKFDPRDITGDSYTRY
ncbi:MAG: leucine-rich repeat protein [Oscillospiraceae bacterium]|jgi:hypothetical protein|nr:leucine-rich repeat protein [Oscillospiraceae bacterium]